ncbi:phage tail tape measure protein [Streptomyces sp. AK08-02]|uniref:phage tail tape measure protein n=1 Tax=Streptomyces sp. AK08-02 TaxID=3028654 RepID=UPI0029AC0B49|nr:phage tail tape measure protein [Streptomyces sp. AK08-02]MDX3753737.1 phage tail tape measure protein [Streptomyces sp. AK08-02]
MPVEVGVGYVSVVPEARGFGRLLNQQISGESARVGSSAGEDAGDGFLGGLGGKLKAGVAGVAVAGGALFAAGFAEAVEQDKATAKLGASLGLTEKETARAGKVAGKVYASGYGESIDQVDESLKSLQRNGVAAINGPRKELVGLSKDALNLADVFDADVADSTKAVGKLMSTGLVKNAKQGFDLLTAGFQSGADQAGDLIDTVNEYSVQWKKAGLSGSTAIGLINQGLKAGARDGDLVADSIKEFSIRAVDGSTTTAAGFKMLGLSADDMAGKFAKGGKSANGVLQLTLDRLRGIKDPVKQAQAATALFGTQSEDLGRALFALDPSKAAAGLGKVGGAADRMGKQLHNTASNDIEVFKRQALQGLANFASKYALPALRDTGKFLVTYVLPPTRTVGGALVSYLVPAAQAVGTAFAATAGWLQKYGAWLIPVGVAVVGLTAVLSAQAITTGIVTGVFSVYRGAILLWSSVTRIATGVQAVFNAVMSANPVGLIIVGILALAAAVVVAYKKSDTFRGIVQAAWAGIKVGWDYLWGALQVGFGYFMTGLRAIGSAASWLWSGVLQPTFSAIATGAKFLFAVVFTVLILPYVLAFKLLAAVGTWLWTNALQPAFNGIAAGAMWLWNNAIGPAVRGIVTLFSWWWTGAKLYFGLVKAGFSAVGSAGVWLYRNALQPAFRGIVTVAGWFWSGVKVVFGYFTTGMRAVGSAGSWLYRNALQPAFNGIGSAASWLWSKALKPAFDAAKTGVRLVGDAFGTAKDAIGKAFGKIESITKKPVNFVIQSVYSNGIKKVWDGVAGFVGLGKLPAAPKLLAEGGRTRGGTPGKDSIPALMMADEFVVKRSSARKIGFGALNYMNQTGELPVQKFAGGGIVGDVAGWIGGKAKAIGGAVMDGVDFLAHPGKLWDKATGFVRDKIGAIGQNPFAQMIGKVPLKMLSSLKDKVVKAATSAFGGGDVGGSGVKRWSSVVLQALKMVGQPASLLPTVLRRMNQESGGNPKAINNWDVNAKNGDPSRGLMQVIGSTFNAYAGKLTSRGIYDPLANIYASMRYALSRYGSLASAYNRAGGYASGGRPKAGELAWVGEQGPELVRFGSGNSTVFDHRTSLGMVAGLGVRGFAKGTTSAAAKARKEVPGDLGSFTKSLTGSASTIASAAKSLADDLKKTGTTGRSLAAQALATSSRLQSLAKQRDAVASKIATAKQAAADQKGTAQDYLGLTNINGGKIATVGDLIAGMQTRQSTLSNFQSLITTAQKKGVTQSVIQQMIAAGPDSGLAGLIAGASAGDVKKINSLAASGAKLSTSYGNTMADAMYDSGVNAGKGFLVGLQSQEKALQQQMTKLGGVLVDSIEHRLRIHSPAKETEYVGRMVGAGIVVGTDKSLDTVRAGAQRLGRAAIPPVMPTAEAVRAAGSASDGQSGHTYNFYPRTLDMTVRDLELLQRRQDALARVGRPR